MAENNFVTKKGFIHDFIGNTLLPITRAELVLDSQGKIALHSQEFLAGNGKPGLISAEDRELIKKLTGGEEMNLSDLYDKINYINTGLQINGVALSFYNETQGSTPINFTSNGSVKFSIQNNAVTANVADTIADKNYVDSKFNGLSVIATGALTFGGVIKQENVQYTDWYNNYLKKECANHYYKVATSVTIQKDHLFESSTDIYVKLGDTLIVYQSGENYKFVHIPSGDDPITRLSIYNGTTQILNEAVDNVTLTFGNEFTVTKPENSNNQTTINIDASKLVSYTDNTPTDISTYNIGTLQIGNTSHTIKGQTTTLQAGVYTEDSVSKQGVTFTQGKTQTHIPVLGAISVKDGGISVNIANNSTDYLKINNNRELEIAICDKNNNGLVNKLQLQQVIAELALTNKFEEISNSLYTSEGTTYYYGGEKLINAITITI